MMSGVRLIDNKRVSDLFVLVAERNSCSSLIGVLVKSVGRDKVQRVLTRLCCGCGCYAAERCSLAVAFSLFRVWLRVSVCGNCSGGLWEEAAKRIPLHMYKRSGAVCSNSGCEIPLASEESRTSGAHSPGCTLRTVKQD